MLSHTVPRKLLDHFAYDDPVTKSKRLWRYQKGRPPSGKVAPKSATRWDGHFADPDDAAKEAVVELRLNREFEGSVGAAGAIRRQIQEWWTSRFVGLR